MEEITEESAELVARVAALDIGKASLVACVRVPHEGKPGRRRQEVRTFATTVRSLLELRDWLVCQGVTLCVMEATSTYWKPPFYLFGDAIECWVVNARDVKNVPGRPKTDRLDAVWLCKLAERGMLRPSFVPQPWQRELRDLCRYRRTLIRERTREKQRAEKLLEDTQIKLSAVISDIFGKSGRDMLEALIAGQRDPYVLAELARGSMRGKKSVLQEALTGHFRDHHGYLLRMMLDRVDALTAQIEALAQRIEGAMAPFAAQVAQLDEIPGIGKTAAQELIAEIGVDMTRFPTAGHLVSWAKYAPKARQSAGKSKPGVTGKGNPWIASTLGEAGIGAARTKTFLGSRYHRLARRRGKQRALVAVGNSILVIAWHLLSDPQAQFTDLGPGWHERLAPVRRKRQLIAELERLSGMKVTLQEAAA
ncbi:MAG TPA: IS110 family transposase [Streptosporangiaceae bacterium]|nr:IS110 family transposase [Streptosporangiaceae bacterium]